MSNAVLTTHPVPRVWIGRWLLLVAALHTAYAVIFFGNVYTDIAQRGVINTVGRDPLTGAAVWFLLFGVMMAMLSLAVTPLERTGQRASLQLLGYSLLALCGVGIALMPASGFWLGLPAGIALVLRR